MLMTYISSKQQLKKFCVRRQFYIYQPFLSLSLQMLIWKVMFAEQYVSYSDIITQICSVQWNS